MIGANFSEHEFIAKNTAVIEANLHNEQFGFYHTYRTFGDKPDYPQTESYTRCNCFGQSVYIAGVVKNVI